MSSRSRTDHQHIKIKPVCFGHLGSLTPPHGTRLIRTSSLLAEADLTANVRLFCVTVRTTSTRPSLDYSLHVNEIKKFYKIRLQKHFLLKIWNLRFSFF